MYKGNQIQRKRLKRFANFLINRVKQQNFNMGLICKTDEEKPNLNSCGTVACAIGHLPLFNSKKFEYVSASHGLWTHNVRDIESGQVDYIYIGKNYFGLSYEQACECFNGHGYNYGLNSSKDITPKMVGEKLLGLLNSKDIK